MYRGVPLIKPVCVIFGASLNPRSLGQAEVNDFDKVPFAAAPAENDVGRLDIAMNQPKAVGFGNRAEYLPEQVQHSRGADRPVSFHQAVERQTGQVLHREIEDAVFGAAVIVDFHRVGVSE